MRTLAAPTTPARATVEAARRIVELERENQRLRGAVAELVLDNRALREALQALAGRENAPPLC